MALRVHVLTKAFWAVPALASLLALSAFVLPAGAAAPAGQAVRGDNGGASCAIPPLALSEKENENMITDPARSAPPGIPGLDMRIPAKLETAVFGLG